MKVHIYKGEHIAEGIDGLALNFGGQRYEAIKDDKEGGWDGIFKTFKVPISWPPTSNTLEFVFLKGTNVFNYFFANDTSLC